MSDRVIAVAVAGAGSFGTKCLEALRAVERLRLVSVADRRAELAEQAGRAHDVPFFSDERQFLSQSRPDVLIVATPPPAAAELIRLAARHGVHVLRPGPPARTLNEAVSLVRAMDAAGRKFAILSPRRFNPSFRNMLLQRDLLGSIFLARAQYMLNWGSQFGWRGDRASAGGGVLLEAGYEMADLLIWALGLPEEVYAVTTRQGRPHLRPSPEAPEVPALYDTDDTAVMTLRYAHGVAGSVIVSWVTSPPVERLILHGQRATLWAEPDGAVLHAPDGTLVRRIEGQTRPLDTLVRQLSHVAEAFASSEPGSPYESPAREHLLTMAVIEAGYLSDRTGQPESPLRLLRAHDLQPADCRTASLPDPSPIE